MSQKLAEEGYTGKQTLRRSERTRKNRTLVDNHSGSETETEDPIALGWNVGNLGGSGTIVEELEGSEYSFGAFSDTAHYNYKFEETQKKTKTVSEETKGFENTDRRDRMTSKDSTDLGRGATPDTGLGDFMRMYIDKQRRRDERREEERREENDRREEERREERE